MAQYRGLRPPEVFLIPVADTGGAKLAILPRGAARVVDVVAGALLEAFPGDPACRPAPPDRDNRC
jgi:hypothetical protein